jgi:hypothetical protein
MSNAVNYVIVPIAALFIIAYATYFLYVAIADLKRLKDAKHDSTNGGETHA